MIDFELHVMPVIIGCVFGWILDPAGLVIATAIAVCEASKAKTAAKDVTGFSAFDSPFRDTDYIMCATQAVIGIVAMLGMHFAAVWLNPQGIPWMHLNSNIFR